MPIRTYKTPEIKLSNSDNWSTPQWLFDQLNDEFHFEVDLCADEFNKKLDKYYSIENSALLSKNLWFENSFANVPYSDAKPFLIKAYEQSVKHHVPIVILLRVDTSNVWWYEHAMKASEIRFIKGRLKFCDENNVEHFTAKWANALLIFDQDLIYAGPRYISWWSYKKDQQPKRLLSFSEDIYD